jgi:hypothetical protein
VVRWHIDHEVVVILELATRKPIVTNVQVFTKSG